MSKKSRPYIKVNLLLVKSYEKSVKSLDPKISKSVHLFWELVTPWPGYTPLSSPRETDRTVKLNGTLTGGDIPTVMAMVCSTLEFSIDKNQ